MAQNNNSADIQVYFKVHLTIYLILITRGFVRSEGRHIYVLVCVSHHGRGTLLHTAKDDSLAVLPDLVLPIAQPVHQSWQNYRQEIRWRERVTER